MSDWTVKTREAGEGTSVVYVNGYLNSRTGKELERVIHDVLDAERPRVVLNFEETRLINSIGISSIIGVVERMTERQGTLAFCSLNRINQELLRITGVSRYVRAFDSEAEALSYFAQSV
ncbi:MAG: STAS domain-containing protein [Candidatus Deferrimicrobiaceae bacterium]